MSSREGGPASRTPGVQGSHHPAAELAHHPRSHRPLPQQVQLQSFWVHCLHGGGGEGQAYRQQLFRLPGCSRERAPTPSPGAARPAPLQNPSWVPGRLWKWLRWPGHRGLLDPPSYSPVACQPPCWPSGAFAGTLEQPPARQAAPSPLLPPGLWSWPPHSPGGPGPVSTCTACRLRSPGAARPRTAPPCRPAACPNASPGPRPLWGACFSGRPGAEECQESD